MLEGGVILGMYQIYGIDFMNRAVCGANWIAAKAGEPFVNRHHYCNYACLVDSAILRDSDMPEVSSVPQNINRYMLDSTPFAEEIKGVTCWRNNTLIIYGMRQYNDNALTVLGTHVYAPTKKNPFRYRILPDKDVYVVFDTKGNMQQCHIDMLKTHTLTNAYFVRGKLYGDVTQYCTITQGTNGKYTCKPGNMLSIWAGESVADNSGHILHTNAELLTKYNDSCPIVLFDKDVKLLPQHYLYDCQWVTTVMFQAKSVRLAKDALFHCRSLNLLYMPTVNWIGENALDSTVMLRRLRIDCDTTTVTESAFARSGLSVLEIHSKQKINMHRYSFGRDETELRVLRIYGNLTCIMDNSCTPRGEMLYKHKHLRHIRMSDDTTQLTDCIFMGCKYLETVEVIQPITSVGGNAFSGCESLVKIDADFSKCEYIGIGAFERAGTARGRCNCLTLNDCMIARNAFAGSPLFSVVRMCRCRLMLSSFALSKVVAVQMQDCNLSAPYIFQRSNELTSVVVQYTDDKAHILGDGCFLACTKLEKVGIQCKGTCVLQKQVFDECTALRELHTWCKVRFIPDVTAVLPQHLQANYVLLGY